MKKDILIIFFLFTSFLLNSACFAQGKDIILISTYTLKKKDIVETKTLSKSEQDEIEATLKAFPVYEGEDTSQYPNYTPYIPKIINGILKINLPNKDGKKLIGFTSGRNLIHKELKPLKNDYQNDFDRGTVEYTSKCRNYSFHKVVIPDGTIIRESNFSQKEPHTKAIEGKNLTFINCNLINQDVSDPTWIMQGSNACQIKRIKKSEEDVLDDKGQKIAGAKKIIISHQVETPRGSGNYMEVSEDVEEVNIGDEYNLLMLRLNK